MTKSWYEKAPRFVQMLFDNELTVFPPNIEFRGEICGEDGGKRWVNAVPQVFPCGKLKMFVNEN